ncbi:hypothetical protein BHE74_00053481 [Ensete ventricosum]|nr:hypothetical protein BHE74_00053481 [Ensete ventricosum]
MDRRLPSWWFQGDPQSPTHRSSPTKTRKRDVRVENKKGFFVEAARLVAVSSTCKKNPLVDLIRTRLGSLAFTTISNVSDSPGEVETATTSTPFPWSLRPTNCPLNTRNWKVDSVILHSWFRNSKALMKRGSCCSSAGRDQETRLTLKVSQPEALDRLATTIVPPPLSAHKYICCVTDLNWN